MNEMSTAGRKADVKSYYDSTADVFDELFGEEQAAKQNLALSHVEMDSKFKVLDIGCGTGELMLKIAEKAQWVLGIDVSDRMLKIAKRKIRELENSFLVCADADNLPVKDDSFNLVFAITLIQNMPDPATTVKEIFRAASSDARLIISGLKKNLSLDYFERLLYEGGFQLDSVLGAGEGIKDFVAVCRKRVTDELKASL